MKGRQAFNTALQDRSTDPAITTEERTAAIGDNGVLNGLITKGSHRTRPDYLQSKSTNERKKKEGKKKTVHGSRPGLEPRHDAPSGRFHRAARSWGPSSSTQEPCRAVLDEQGWFGKGKEPGRGVTTRWQVEGRKGIFARGQEIL